MAQPTHKTGPRVGVSGSGGEGTRFPWRYWLTDERTVSAYRPAYRRAGVGRRPVRDDDAGRTRSLTALRRNCTGPYCLETL